MGNRGRKSAASVEVIQRGSAEKINRPDPPLDLTQEQSQVWWTVVESLASDWFQPDTYPLLAAYCRHTISARKVGQLIEAAEAAPELDIEEYDRLLKMQEREGRAISSLATRMRISQQSTTNHRGNKDPVRKKTPWQK